MYLAPPLRVLIADDDRDTVDSTAALVSHWGHDARTAYNGSAALGAAFAFRPDVALLDVGMPRLDGCRVARELRRWADFRGTLLVAVTGHHDRETRRRAEQSGFDSYLVKPADPELLERVLRVQQMLKGYAAEVRRDSLEKAESILGSAAHVAELRARIDRLGATIRKSSELLLRDERLPAG